MRIVLLGAPGSGKGTQGKFITEKYKIPQISIGDILRENIYLKTVIGEKIKDTIMKGKLVSDCIICSLVYERIQKKDCINGFLLDGFPRNIIQAQYISEKKIKIDYVLYLSIPYPLIFERISGRRVHTPSGRIYHINFKPPKEKEKDDLTGEKLEIREDDKIEIIKERLKEYTELTYPLIKYFKNEDNKENIKYFEINGKENYLETKKKIDFVLNNNTYS